MAKIKAAVIFGGTAREHDLSLASAAEVISSIPRDKYEVICIGITRKGRWLYFPGDAESIADGTWDQDPDCTSAFISPDPLHRGIITIENGETSLKKIDVVFPILMGKRCGDGTIQGLLDLSGIPYVGSGVLASASCTDKSHTHMVMDDYDIKTAQWKLITQREINYLDKKCAEISSELGFPLVVKPANSGSNAGVSFAHNSEELLTASGYGLDLLGYRRDKRSRYPLRSQQLQCKHRRRPDHPCRSPQGHRGKGTRDSCYSFQGSGLQGNGKSRYVPHGQRRAPAQQDRHYARTQKEQRVPETYGGAWLLTR